MRRVGIKGGWAGQEHVVNLNENGRKAMICSMYIRECDSTLYVGMPRKQNGRPIHCIVKSSPQNAAIGKF